MDANKTELLHKKPSFEIVGAAMCVLDELGHGLNEKVCENAIGRGHEGSGCYFEC